MVVCLNMQEIKMGQGFEYFLLQGKESLFCNLHFVYIFKNPLRVQIQHFMNVNLYIDKKSFFM